MNIDCRVIGDLLPLYADESCSDASRALVDDHLKTCPRCRETLARMKSEQFLPAAQKKSAYRRGRSPGAQAP